MSASLADCRIPDHRLHQETFVVIRSLLADEFIVKRFLVMPLYHFLQNCLAVIEQLLVFNIRQNEAVDKSFCRLKTAVQIDRTDHGFQRIRKNRLASSSAGQVLPLA